MLFRAVVGRCQGANFESGTEICSRCGRVDVCSVDTEICSHSVVECPVVARSPSVDNCRIPWIFQSEKTL